MIKGSDYNNIICKLSSLRPAKIGGALMVHFVIKSHHALLSTSVF